MGLAISPASAGPGVVAMEYHISVNEHAEGLLRYDSPEAERFIRPVVYPTASCLLRVMAELTSEADGQVIASGAELGGRCGVGEAKIAKAMSRLAAAQHGIVALEAVDDETANVSVNQWLNPPRASARAQRYPAELIEEFNDFLAKAEAIVEPHRTLVEAEASSTGVADEAMSI